MMLHLHGSAHRLIALTILATAWGGSAAVAPAQDEIAPRISKTILFPSTPSPQGDYTITTKIIPAEHLGACPVKATFVATITATKTGPVKYKLHTSDNVYDPVREMMFTAPGTKSFAVTRNLPPPGSGWGFFEIVGPVSASSEKAYYDIKCTNDPTTEIDIAITMKIVPAEHLGACPVKVAFVATITATKTGPVKYKLHTSDNVYDPVREMMFTAPGTKSFAVTRNLPPPGSGWGFFEIVGPMSTSSEKAYYDIKCTNDPAVEAAPPPARATRRPGAAAFPHFAAPTWDGKRVDLCLVWGSQCGEPAATEFCKRTGYAKATAWQPEHDIGAKSPTLVLGANKVCSDASCDGFASITCSK